MDEFESMWTGIGMEEVTLSFSPPFFPPAILKTSHNHNASIVSSPFLWPVNLSISSSNVNLGWTYVDLFIWTDKSSLTNMSEVLDRQISDD